MKRTTKMEKFIAKYQWDKILEVSPCHNCLVQACCKFKNDKFVTQKQCEKAFFFLKFIKEYVTGIRYTYFKTLNKSHLEQIRNDENTMKELEDL